MATNDTAGTPTGVRASCVLVRVDVYDGDEIQGVQLVELDTRTLQQLRSFAATGRCEQALLHRLASMVPEVLPAVRASVSELDQAYREYLCAAYAVDTGRSVEVAATFRRQMK